MDPEDEAYSSGQPYTTSTRLLAKRKELLSTQAALRAKRQEFLSRLDQIQLKERQLGKQREQLTENMVQLDKFIRENEMRKERAEQKQKQEEKSRKTLEEQIQQLMTQIESRKEELQQKKHVLDHQYKRYHRYLQQVVAKAHGVVSTQGAADSASLDDVDSIMTRYQSLISNHRKLKQQSQRLNEEKIVAENELKRYKDEKKGEILIFNMTISSLNRELENQVRNTSQSLKQMEENQTKSSLSKVVRGQVEMACKNLYRRVTTFTKLQSKTREAEEDGDIDKMLERIRIKIEDFGIIEKLCREQMELQYEK